MSRPRPGGRKRPPPDRPLKAGPPPAEPAGWRAYCTPSAIRETIESIAVALVLAFLVRGFVAEAFVIPTGSMAPTLMGRHRDVVCLKCGYNYQIGASVEMDRLDRPNGKKVISGTCPMCRFTMDVGPDNSQQTNYPSFSGDRIIAARFAYDLSKPKRWDVVVFRFPLNSVTDYIKRLAGLPGESLRIQYGDVWVKKAQAEAGRAPSSRPAALDDQYEIARKPPEKILATMRAVYDNDYVVPELIDKGWVPPRWAPTATGPGSWAVSQDFKSFQTDGAAKDDVWIAYSHTPPGYDLWAYLTGAERTPPSPPRPQLITDFTAYDTQFAWQYASLRDPPISLPGGLGMVPPNPAEMGLNWVGDLVVEFEVEAAKGEGEILVVLVKGGRQFLCRLDMVQGTAALSIPGVKDFHAASAAGMRGAGKHRVRLAHVDQQLCLWIDNRVVAFDAPTTYGQGPVATTVPNHEDLLPVRIGGRGAAARVSHLRIFRDIYYIAQEIQDERLYPPVATDLDPTQPGYPFGEVLPDGAINPDQLQAYLGDAQNRDAFLRDRRAVSEAVTGFLANPQGWPAFGRRRSLSFTLKADQYFMLGDNSAESQDSRLWDAKEFYVAGELLVGKGIVIYWPHSWDKIPGTSIPLPFFPHFSRMGLIR